ncbi:formyltransferase family protein [Pseudoroseomonas cervicalis]|uniref:formyltransferase family protein n=1 Tax=Teichococcus cervicalis TaxID=204525 RepID=UPI0022F1574F|nr:formyltransferase family protein [Pseudoroseomonas cervicalis]WBV43098.1 formyltransferase family protein [Pseudoroseomonas cervicalis]
MADPGRTAPRRPLRIALLTLESALSAAPVLGFARAQAEAGRLALIGRSLPYRPATGGMAGQLAAHWRRSGPRFLPFLMTQYGLPQLLGDLRRATGGGALSGLARRQGVPMLAVANVNGADFAAALAAAGVELIVSFHFDQILSGDTLARVPRGGINIHPSLLPRHRGPVPTFWAMQESPPAFGVTVHRMVPRIDAGAVLAQRAVALPPGSSAASAARALHAEGALLAGQVLRALEEGHDPAAGAADPAPGPYCPFPSAGALRRAARQGARLVGWSDLRAALCAPVG